jgi:hypothetical protein
MFTYATPACGVQLCFAAFPGHVDEEPSAVKERPRQSASL